MVRVSTDEHLALATKAKAAGITVSALLRDHIERVRIVNHADKEAWLRAAVSLNNIVAALARTVVALRASDAVAALAYLAAVHRRFDELQKALSGHDR